MTEPEPQRARWLKILLMLLCVAAGVGVLRFTVWRTRPVVVTVQPVGRGRVEDSIVNSRAGTVQSRRRSEISPGVPGLVVDVPARKGERVKEGDVLLRLDDAEHRAQVELAARSLEAARASSEQLRLEAEQAQRYWQRIRTLGREQAVSATVLEQEETRAATTQVARVVAEARVREAEAAWDVARAALAKTTLRAPFAGVVLEVTAEVGEWISPSPPGVFIPPVVDLIDPGALYVSGPIDEADVGRLRVGLPVRITLDAFRGRTFAGVLTYVASFVETRQDQNRTLRVEAEFRETDLPPNLLPGLSADVEIIFEARDDVLRIPTYALLEGSKVLVLEGGRLVERRVSTGLRNWSYTQVESGLEPGERIVVSLDRPEVVAGARAVAAAEENR